MDRPVWVLGTKGDGSARVSGRLRGVVKGNSFSISNTSDANAWAFHTQVGGSGVLLIPAPWEIVGRGMSLEGQHRQNPETLGEKLPKVKKLKR